MQQKPFDFEAAKRAKEEALVRVASDKGPLLEYIVNSIATLANVRSEFTTDDLLYLFPQLEDMNCDARIIGAAIKVAQARKICTPTRRYAASDRVKSHGRPKMIWHSLIYQVNGGNDK